MTCMLAYIYVDPIHAVHSIQSTKQEKYTPNQMLCPFKRMTLRKPQWLVISYTP